VSVGISYGLRGFKQGLREGYHSLRAPTISDKDCVLFLPLNSVSNRKVFDLSGYGNHGTVYGAVLRDIGEEYYLKFKGNLIKVGGRALYFYGDDYVEVPDSVSLDITNEITIEAWIYRKEANSRDLILDKYESSTTYGYRLGIMHTNVLRLAANFGGDWSYIDSTRTVSSNQWVYVAVTYNNPNVNFYINEKNAGSGQKTGPINSGNNVLRIGNVAGGTFGPLDGLTALVRVYKGALSPRKIKEHFELERVIFGV